MFIKPFKLKSNVQLKGSEVKKLKARLQKSFPDLNDENIALLIPNKSTITHIKITTHGGVLSNIFSVDKRPMFFEDETGLIVPTIYTLWVIKDLVPYFTTHPAVLPKLANGADLMLPGVMRREAGMNAYGRYKKDQIVSVNLTSNKAAVGVGRLARSSDDLFMCGGHGPCVKMLHVFGDKLWGIEPTVTMQIPDLESTVALPNDDDFPELGATRKTIAPKEHIESFAEIAGNLEKSNEDLVVDEGQDNCNENDKLVQADVEVKETMDDILKAAFLTALKYDRKVLSLPLLSSNFYRLHVIPAATKQIDLKQTSYKKLSKFLNEMSDRGIIVVREETKGVEKIVSVDFDHPDVINFIPDDKTTDERNENNAPQLFHSEMMELYTVTEATIALFSALSYKRGDGLSSIDVKKLLKEYISKNKLNYVENTKIIKLDQRLSIVCKVEQCSFDDLYRTILSKMDHTYEMRAKNDTSCNKPPITMSLATRSGNKKVTLVNNLEAYGIIIQEFAKACKLGAAASTTLIKSPNQKQIQLQIQGNQIKFLHNLLTETYKIPPKQIHGLDLAKKEKKKKN